MLSNSLPQRSPILPTKVAELLQFIKNAPLFFLLLYSAFGKETFNIPVKLVNYIMINIVHNFCYFGCHRPHASHSFKWRLNTYLFINIFVRRKSSFLRFWNYFVDYFSRVCIGFHQMHKYFVLLILSSLFYLNSSWMFAGVNKNRTLPRWHMK